MRILRTLAITISFLSPRALDLVLDLLRAVGVALLEPGVQEDVGEQAAPEAVAEREQRRHLGRPDPVDRAAHPGVERHVLHRLEQQRIQVEHAELAVADPRLALAQALERADVHEHRARAAELDVVGRGVLQDHVALERREQQVELHERGVLQHRERPLVRVRHERDPLVPEHAGGLVDEQPAQRLGVLGALGAHEPLVVEQARVGQRLEVAQAVGRECAVDLAVAVEDAALGVAKAAWLEAGFGAGVGGRPHGRRRIVEAEAGWPRAAVRPRSGGVRAPGPTACSAVSGSSLRIRRKRRMRFQYSLAVTATAATPPARIWRIMLPLPGSRYARTVVIVVVALQ